ncbi:hypothetical protein NKR19_g10064, partial [Coniochaeta hoffmannii]
PPPGGFASDNESLSSISSPSDVSDRELEYHLEDQKSRTARNSLPPPPPPGRGSYISDSDDEFERDPWNAVAVVGFRVYYKAAEDEGKKKAKGGEGQETVKIRVIRPVCFPVEKDGETEKKKVMLEGKVKETGMDESMVLDLDDSAKDATLQGEKLEDQILAVEEGKDGKDGGPDKNDNIEKAVSSVTDEVKVEDVKVEDVKAEDDDSKTTDSKKEQ